MSNTHARFVRALEAKYDLALASAIAHGFDDESAHAEAFDHVKQAGARALADLRRAGRHGWNSEAGGLHESA